MPWTRWGHQRRAIAAMQWVFRDAGIEAGIVDGLYGPQTAHAFDTFKHVKLTGDQPENWRDRVKPKSPESTSSTKWPRQSGVARFFGAPGANQVRIDLPYPQRIAWDTGKTITHTWCHGKVRIPLQRIFAHTLDHYGMAEIKRLHLDMFGGCFNKRRMRGGRSWSMHAWGIAWDMDPIRNQFRWGRDRASLDPSRLRGLLALRLCGGRHRTGAGKEFRLDAFSNSQDCKETEKWKISKAIRPSYSAC